MRSEAIWHRAPRPRAAAGGRQLLGGLLLSCVLAVVAFALLPARARADAAEPTPAYQTLDELSGKRFAYVNGSVYNQNVLERLEGTSQDFYPSLAECVAAVEAGKEDAAVQLSYCCQLAVNRRPGTVALLPEPVAEVSEGFFFPQGSPLTSQFNELIERFSKDGTLEQLEEKWVAASEDGKTLPEQDWDAPNGEDGPPRPKPCVRGRDASFDMKGASRFYACVWGFEQGEPPPLSCFRTTELFPLSRPPPTTMLPTAEVRCGSHRALR